MSLIEENAEERRKREAESLTEDKVRAAIDQAMGLPKGRSVPACRCCGAPGFIVRPVGLRGMPAKQVVLCQACDGRRTTDATWPAGAPCGRCKSTIPVGGLVVLSSGRWVCKECEGATGTSVRD